MEVWSSSIRFLIYREIVAVMVQVVKIKSR